MIIYRISAARDHIHLISDNENCVLVTDVRHRRAKGRNVENLSREIWATLKKTTGWKKCAFSTCASPFLSRSCARHVASPLDSNEEQERSRENDSILCRANRTRFWIARRFWEVVLTSSSAAISTKKARGTRGDRRQSGSASR